MPAQSQAQRGLIFARRDKYKSKDKTPDKWKWIWDEDWENKGKLPKKKNKNETVQNVVMENFRAKTVNEGSMSLEDTPAGQDFLEMIIDVLQGNGSTWEEAEFIIDQAPTSMLDIWYNEHHYDGRSIEDIATEIQTKAYHKKSVRENVNETFKDGNYETDNWVDLVIDIDSMSPQEYDLLTSWNNISRVELEGYNDYNLIRFVEDDDEVIDLISNYIVDDNGDLDPYVE